MLGQLVTICLGDTLSMANQSIVVQLAAKQWYGTTAVHLGGEVWVGSSGLGWLGKPSS